MQFSPGDRVFGMADTYAPWRQEGMAHKAHVAFPEREYTCNDLNMQCVRAGTYAEYICVNEDQLARMPDSMSFEDAAALPLVTLTAWQVSQPSICCCQMSGSCTIISDLCKRHCRF